METQLAHKQHQRPVLTRTMRKRTLMGILPMGGFVALLRQAERQVAVAHLHLQPHRHRLRLVQRPLQEQAQLPLAELADLADTLSALSTVALVSLKNIDLLLLTTTHALFFVTA